MAKNILKAELETLATITLSGVWLTDAISILEKARTSTALTPEQRDTAHKLHKELTSNIRE